MVDVVCPNCNDLNAYALLFCETCQAPLNVDAARLLHRAAARRDGSGNVPFASVSRRPLTLTLQPGRNRGL